MIKLIKNAQVYAPAYLGRRDVLLSGGRIAAVEREIPAPAGFPIEVEDLGGAVLAPGYIDLHVHITGGGGEEGFASRVPESTLTALTTAGVTTVVGLLGTDGVTRSVENLLAKAHALTEEGITALALTGAYGYPSATLTGSVTRDIMFADPIVGVKIAIADHRSSNVTAQELIRTCSDARLGGLLSAKAGITVMHMGGGDARFALLNHVLDHSEVPAENLVPTHVGRNEALLRDAVAFSQRGGNIDFTAAELDAAEGCARKLSMALSLGAEPSRMTLSSDGFGSMPRFNEQGRCIGLTYGTPHTLHKELIRLVQNEGMELSCALRFLTENPARVLKLEARKGCIRPGADADLIAYGANMELVHVWAKGQRMVRDGKPTVLGRFE